jgi:hypothetical protein
MKCIAVAGVGVVVAGVGCFREASHAELPQLESAGGPVQASPRWQIVTFQNDPIADDVMAFASSLARSEYWKTVIGEYGIGTAVAVAAPRVDFAPAMVSYADIPTYIASHLDPLANGWLPPTSETAYVVVYPPNTMLVGGCTSFSGYHAQFAMPDGTPVAYAVIPRCDYGGYLPLDVVTATLVHELAETATDPLIDSARAYSHVSDYAWAMFYGAEVGDMCEGTYWYVEPELGRTVPRIWSNAAARAGHDPCVPHPSGDVYFLAAPDLPDTVMVIDPLSQGPVATPGVRVPIGSARTIDIRLFSDQSTAQIGVWVVESPIFGAPVPASDLALSLDRATGTNGDTLHLTIRALGDSGSLGREYVNIVAQLGDVQHTWPVVVSFQ